MNQRIKGLIIISLIAMLTAALAGCHFYINLDNMKTVVGNGDMETKTVTLDQQLSGVKNMGSIDVVIDPSLTGEAIIEGESNLIDLIELRQDTRGVLSVSYEDGTSIVLSKRMTVTIPAFSGGLIESNGSGCITLAGNEAMKGQTFDVQIGSSGDIALKLEAQTLSVNINGSGTAELDVKAQALDAGIDGSGDIETAGTADEISVSVNGSGCYNAFNCATKNADVGIYGSGNVNLNVSGKLTGSVNGSGDITYEGSPSVSVSDQGSGDVQPR